MTDELKNVARSLCTQSILSEFFAREAAAEEFDVELLMERVGREWPSFTDQAKGVIAALAFPSDRLIEAYRRELKSLSIEREFGAGLIARFHKSIIEAALGEELPKKAASDW